MTNRQPLTDDDLLPLFEGALSDAEARALMDRVQDDPAALAQLAEWSAQNDAIAALYPVQRPEDVPARLTNIIRDARTEPTQNTPWLRIAAMIGVLAIGLGAGWALRGTTSPATRALAAAAKTVHQTYVTEVRHPVEVLASDREQLNGWMSKRLGREIAPPDLTAAGFTLLGGRVVPGVGGAAGMYMYEDAEGRRVTLYMEPAPASTDTSFQYAQDGALQSYSWRDEGLGCAVVGEVPQEVLRALAESSYDQLI